MFRFVDRQGDPFGEWFHFEMEAGVKWASGKEDPDVSWSRISMETSLRSSQDVIFPNPGGRLES